MTIAIVTDTASDILDDLLLRPDIFVVSTSVIVNNQSYLDRDLPTSQLLQYLENGQYSTTSQPAPDQFLSTYSRAMEEYEQILGIHVGSKLSGLFNGAKLVTEELGMNITLFDTGSVSIGSGYYVSLAAKLIDLGFEIPTIVSIFESIKDKIVLRVLIEDVDYIKRGGRVSVRQYWLLRLLNLRPIVANENGLIVAKGMSIGRKSGIRKIVSITREHYEFGYDVYVGHINTPVDFDSLVRQVNKFCDKPIQVKISSTLISHTGPKALGILIGPGIEIILNMLS